MTTYAITTDSIETKNAEPTTTDDLDEALMIAERWAAEIIHNLRPDYPHLSAVMIDDGRFWVISNGFGGERLRTISVTDNRPIANQLSSRICNDCGQPTRWDEACMDTFCATCGQYPANDKETTP